jgi:hypothetical protein
MEDHDIAVRVDKRGLVVVGDGIPMGFFDDARPGVASPTNQLVKSLAVVCFEPQGHAEASADVGRQWREPVLVGVDSVELQDEVVTCEEHLVLVSTVA